MEILKYEFQEFPDIDEEKEEQDDNFNDSENNQQIEEKLKDIIESTKQEAIKQAEILKEQAKKEGFETGYKEGFDKGFQESSEKLNKIIDDYIEKLQKTIEQLINKSNTIEKQYEELENNAADAVLSIASKMIAKKIDDDKETIMPMIKEALSLTENKKIKIRLNPENAAYIENKISSLADNKVIEIIKDPKLTKGSILLEEEDGNIIDAGIDAKLEQIKNSIKNE